MLHIEHRLTAPVPKLDGRTNLESAVARRGAPRLRSGAGLLAFCAGVAGTAIWLAFVAWCLFQVARLVVG